jgi:hypothetical protein
MFQAEWRDNSGRYEPDLVVTVIPQEPGERYAVSVELRHDDEGPYVTGVAVRRHVLAGYGGQRTHVSPRDVQRLPLARIVQAALAFASTAAKPRPDEKDPEGFSAPFHTLIEGESSWATYYDVTHADEWRELGFDVPLAMVEAGKELRLPRGRPQWGKSVDFYRDLAKAYKQFELAGLSPVKEIARRKRVPENTVHQWVHRMRHDLGFLEPSPRSKRKEKDDG